MAFDSKGPLNALATLVGGISGIQSVYKGAPASIGNKVSAYVALVGQAVLIKATNLVQREAGYAVNFAYRVEGAPDDAETTIADAVDDFIAAIYDDLTLGGLATKVTVDLSLASSPQYQIVAGQEFRIYPVVVRCTQQQAF